MLVRPTNTAPAARKRAITGASDVAAGSPASTFDPAVVTAPVTSNKSLIEIGNPSRGRGGTPARRNPSLAAASAAALSAIIEMNTLDPSPSGSLARASAVSSRAAAVVVPDSRSPRMLAIGVFGVKVIAQLTTGRVSMS
jgi:hypothetical protein